MSEKNDITKNLQIPRIMVNEKKKKDSRVI